MTQTVRHRCPAGWDTIRGVTQSRAQLCLERNTFRIVSRSICWAKVDSIQRQPDSFIAFRYEEPIRVLYKTNAFFFNAQIVFGSDFTDCWAENEQKVNHKYEWFHGHVFRSLLKSTQSWMLVDITSTHQFKGFTLQFEWESICCPFESRNHH